MPREAKKKLAARIMAGLLALLMVGGTAYYMVYMLVISLSAAEPVDLTEDLNIRVGLMYGDGVTVDFETKTDAGYTVGVQPLTDDVYDFVPFWEIATGTVTVAADANLLKQGSDYVITNNTSGVVIGGYHIEFQTDFSLADMAYAETMMSSVDAVLSAMGMYCFPTYINGVIRLRVGSFASRAEAESVYSFIAGILGFIATVVEPSDTAVSVVDPSSDRILFEYESADGTSLGLRARSLDGQDAYIQTPKKNIYTGVFAYTRYQDPADGVDGVAVTNVLTLDEYAASVVPYEVTNTWPLESLKAFSIVVRSYAAYNLDKHDKAYQFDLCNSSSCCQLYCGAGKINDNVLTAVRSTHGLVITYDGKVVNGLFASGHGNGMISTGDVWGYTSLPYLTAHETPWERYAERTNGLWTAEVSPTELLQYLRDKKGYKELSGAIASIEILEYAENSTYVKKLRITDTKGTSIEIKTTDKVRLSLGAYVKSANFVVGQGSVDYTVDTVSVVGETTIDGLSAQKEVLAPVTSDTASNTASVISTSTVPVLTASSYETISLTDVLVLTAGSLTGSSTDGVYVQTADGLYQLNEKTSGTSGQGITYTVQEYTLITEQKTAYASSSSNFIFVGKGYGHGTGMSQYGAKDLADLGYGYEYIINAYYTGVEIVHYKTVKGLR